MSIGYWFGMSKFWNEYWFLSIVGLDNGFWFLVVVDDRGNSGF